MEEARLSALGTLCAIPDADGIVGDIGGGSLELVEICAAEKRRTTPHWRLAPFRSLKAVSVPKKPAKNLSLPLLDDLSWLSNAKKKIFYAVGGSWRALAKKHMDSENYPLRIVHGYSLSRSRALEMTREIAGISSGSLQGSLDPGAKQGGVGSLRRGAHGKVL